MASDRPAILDRSIFEDAAIFARNSYETGIMNERDYQTYLRIYESILPSMTPPDLIIYLQASVPTLMRRIRLRGREYEQAIPREYLAQLNDLYEDFIRSFDLSPKLVLPADDLDFVNSYHDFDYILDMIDTMRRDPNQLVLPGF
jgi:deoxyadenosine/deoxycytidine kinase